MYAARRLLIVALQREMEVSPSVAGRTPGLRLKGRAVWMIVPLQKAGDKPPRYVSETERGTRCNAVA